MTNKEIRLKEREHQKQIADLRALVDTLQTCLRRAQTALEGSEEYAYVFTQSARWAIDEKL